MKIKVIALLASASLTILIAALFMPLFCAFALWDIITVSIWEFSHLIACLCATAIAAITLMPLVYPGRKLWLFPFLSGITLLVLVLCAVGWSFVFPGAATHSNHVSDLFFHLYSLILLAVGGLLCATEGFVARKPSCSASNA